MVQKMAYEYFKKRAAIHEAGHVVMNMVFQFEIESVVLIENKQEPIEKTFIGQTKYKVSPPNLPSKEVNVKNMCILYAGWISEKIYTKTESEWTLDSFQAFDDLLTAQDITLQLINQHVYIEHYAPLLLEYTKNVLEVNWKVNSQVAYHLYKYNTTSKEFIEKQASLLARDEVAKIPAMVKSIEWNK